MKTKVIAVLLSIVMLVPLFAGCTRQTPNPPATDKPDIPPDAKKETPVPQQPVESDNYQEIIRYCPAIDFREMDTQNTTSSTDLAIFRLVYNNLIEFDTVENKYIPALAESWNQISPTEIEFNLRKGVKFSNGVEFTAEDVSFTFNRGKEQNVSKTKLKTLDRVEIIDPYKIKMVLNTPNMDFMSMLPDGRLSILCKQAFDTMPAEEAIKIGTGPFKYEEWAEGSHVTLVRYDDCWEGAAKTKKIIFRLIHEASARLIALQNKEVDIIYSPETTELHHISEDPALRLYTFKSTNMRFFALNTLAAPLDNIKVRQAIAYGINRDEFNDVSNDGTGTVVDNIMHPDNEYYKKINATEYNPEKAKQLLAEAGYKNGDITLELLGVNKSSVADFATVFMSQMKAIGINVNFHPEETAAFNADRVGGKTFHVIIDAWAGYITGPDNALRTLFYSGASLNECNIHDEFIESTLDEAIKTLDNAKRLELYGALEQYVNDQAYVIPIVLDPGPIAAKASLQGVVPPHGLIHCFKKLYISIPNN